MSLFPDPLWDHYLLTFLDLRSLLALSAVSRYYHSTVKGYQHYPSIKEYTQTYMDLLLDQKIRKMNLTWIRVPELYLHGDEVRESEVRWEVGYSMFGQITLPMIHELHQLLTEDYPKCYDLTFRDLVIGDDGILYLYRIKKKNHLHDTTFERLFYEVSWLLQGDIIDGRDEYCRTNHPWQAIQRSCCYHPYLKYLPDEIHSEILRWRKHDLIVRDQNFSYYLRTRHGIINPDDVDLQVAVGWYLLDLGFERELLQNPHLLKEVINEVVWRGIEDNGYKGPAPPINNYEVYDLLEEIHKRELG